MFCTKCGKEMTDGAKVCSECGQVVGSKKPADSATVRMPNSFLPKDVAGWTGILKFMSIVRLVAYMATFTSIADAFSSAFRMSDMSVLGLIIGLVVGLCAVVRDMIYANIAENISTLGKNVAYHK